MQNTINGRTTDGRTDRLIPENIMTPPPILRWRRHKNVVNRCIRLHATVLSNVISDTNLRRRRSVLYGQLATVTSDKQYLRYDEKSTNASCTVGVRYGEIPLFWKRTSCQNSLQRWHPSVIQHHNCDRQTDRQTEGRTDRHRQTLLQHIIMLRLRSVQCIAR